MKQCTRERGQALLLMLSMLSVASVAGLSSWVNDASLPDAERVMFQRRALLSARQALLVYATVYPTLYGPRGAGPGHLPCPDTRGAEGPDPPCGRQLHASGRLPRHVSLPSRRYSIVQQAALSFDYSVDTQLINNPTNRIVNDAVLMQMGAASQPLARLSQRSPNAADVGSANNVGSTAPSTDRQVVLFAHALLPGLKAIARAWLHERLVMLEPINCKQGDNSIKHLLLSISDPLPESVAAPCGDDGNIEKLLSRLHIEGLPASTHWFVRNQWHRRFDVFEPGAH